MRHGRQQHRLAPRSLDRALTMALPLGGGVTIVGSTALRLLTGAAAPATDDESDLDLVWTEPATGMLEHTRRTFGGDVHTWTPKALALGYTAYQCRSLNGRCAVEVAPAHSWTALTPPHAIAYGNGTLSVAAPETLAAVKLMLLATRAKSRDADDVETLQRAGADATMTGREVGRNVAPEMVPAIAEHTRRLPRGTRAWAAHAVTEAYAETTPG